MSNLGGDELKGNPGNEAKTLFLRIEIPVTLGNDK